MSNMRKTVGPESVSSTWKIQARYLNEVKMVGDDRLELPTLSV